MGEKLSIILNRHKAGSSIPGGFVIKKVKQIFDGVYMEVSLKNLKVAKKFLVLIISISVSLIVIGVFSYSTIDKVKVNGEQYNKIVLGKDLIADILPPPEYIIESYLVLHQLTAETDENLRNTLIEKCKKLEDDYYTRHDYWNKELAEGEIKNILMNDSYKPAREFYSVVNNRFIPSIKDGNIDSAKSILGTVLKINYEKHREAIDKVVMLSTEANLKLEKETTDIISSRTLLMILLMLGLSITFLLLLKYISRLIEVPLKLLIAGAEKIIRGDYNTTVKVNSRDELGLLADTFNAMVSKINSSNNELLAEKQKIEERDKEAIRISEGQKKYLNNNIEKILSEMGKFAKGDLSVSLKVENDDEIGKLFNGFNMSVDNIKNIMQKIGDAIEATASASNQISSSSEEMAAGAQEQSSQTSEVASAVEQMTKTIMETTKHASQATESARSAGVIAKEGGSVVNETIAGMNQIADVVKKSAETVQELGKGSDHIGQIIQVIDDIADQTNLLALNAAIEAARAGEQGRGFAVVADEVRKLAERTTKATKEIATMIKQIQKDTLQAVESMQQGTNEVEKGKALARRAGSALEQIINGSQDVVNKVTQVAAASEEQASAAEQISRNIDGINNVTQETAQGIQQIAKASEDLSNLTVQLQDMISMFKQANNVHLLKYSRSNQN